jgi:hypothetical protein
VPSDKSELVINLRGQGWNARLHVDPPQHQQIRSSTSACRAPIWLLGGTRSVAVPSTMAWRRSMSLRSLASKVVRFCWWMTSSSDLISRWKIHRTSGVEMTARAAAGHRHWSCSSSIRRECARPRRRAAGIRCRKVSLRPTGDFIRPIRGASLR